MAKRDTDIVERLRYIGFGDTNKAPQPSDILMLEAANEIERLRAALREIVETWDGSMSSSHAVKIARAALEG
jgi:hypothetical protein